MTEYYTQSQAITLVPSLSHARLKAFMEADLIMPQALPDGPVFRPVDLARLALLCDLADQFDMDGDALGVVIALIDQLHTARLRLRAMAQAMEPEPQDLRLRVGARFVGFLAD
jgi:chaperone modulatory protein CbpM